MNRQDNLNFDEVKFFGINVCYLSKGNANGGHWIHTSCVIYIQYNHLHRLLARAKCWLLSVMYLYQLIEAGWRIYALVNWDIIGSDWLVAFSAPSHYQNQCWFISIGPLRTNSSQILIGIQTFSFEKIHVKCRLQNVHYFVSAFIC